MKIYDYAAAPNCRRVRIFLAEKGIDVPFENVDLMKGENLGEAYRQRNPHGVVPLLELDDGTRIGESLAICRYFEELHPEPALFGTGAVEKALVEMWSRRAELEGMFAVADVFRNSVPAFAGKGLPGVGDGVAQIPALIERGKDSVDRFFHRLDRHLAGREFLATDRFTVADITALVTVDFGKWAKLSIPDDCANVKRWYGAVSARPAVKS